MAITINDALKFDFFSECELIAGKNGTDNIIQYTDSMEVPDIQPWLLPNLLMITTGYTLRNSPKGLIKLIHDMHNAGCAGLAIKTKFIGDLLSDAVKVADEINLPIIVIPNDMPSARISVPLMKAIYDEQNASIKSDYLFLDLITNNYDSEDSVKLRSKALNWPLPPYRLIVFSREEKSSKEFSSDKVQENFSSVLKNARFVSGSERVTAIITADENYTSSAPSPSKGTCQVKSLSASLLEYLNSSSSLSVRIGISDSVESITEFHTAFQDALDAIEIGKIKETHRLNKDSEDFRVSAIEDNRLEQSLLSLKSDKNFAKCIDKYFSALKEYDTYNSSNLYETLCVYVTNMGKKAQTAEAMFLHRNTLLYRLSKIEEITGYDISDSETILRLALLVKLDQYVH